MRGDKCLVEANKHHRKLQLKLLPTGIGFGPGERRSLVADISVGPMPPWRLAAILPRVYGRAMDAPRDSGQRSLPTAADVDAAARRLEGVALRTPLLTSPVLDALTGGRLFLKPETLQRTGSFKFRGAYNKVSSIPPERRAGGVVAFSSGNHAQGVAAAAKLLDMPAVIVMPRDAPRPKRERTAA